jgi:hypothetical protein
VTDHGSDAAAICSVVQREKGKIGEGRLCAYVFTLVGGEREDGSVMDGKLKVQLRCSLMSFNLNH